MKLFLMILTISLFLFSGCDDDSSSSDSNGTVSDGDVVVVDDDSVAETDVEINDSDVVDVNDEVVSPDDDTAVSGNKYCMMGCDSVADCAGDFSLLDDEDNWECKSNICIYKGCNSTDECTSVYQSTDYACNPNGSYGYPECAKLCTSASDCSLENVAYDEDNYACDDGFCVYKGCNTDAECAEIMSYSEGTWECLETEWINIKTCQEACEEDSDCSDEETYRCQDGKCVMKNCDSDSWCEDNFGTKYDCLDY